MPIKKYKGGYKVENTMGTKPMTRENAVKQLRAIKASQRKRKK